MELDAKDKKLLKLLQADGRASLTELAKAVNLSIDSTHKRIKKLRDAGVVTFSVFIDPKTIGYELVVNAQIKLSNASEEELNRFIRHLTAHPNVIELISVLGDYDFTCVFIARNTNEYELVSRKVRQEFKHIITGWSSAINLRVHKFEEYDVEQLFKENKK